MRTLYCVRCTGFGGRTTLGVGLADRKFGRNNLNTNIAGLS